HSWLNAFLSPIPPSREIEAEVSGFSAAIIIRRQSEAAGRTIAFIFSFFSISEAAALARCRSGCDPTRTTCQTRLCASIFVETSGLYPFDSSKPASRRAFSRFRKAPNCTVNPRVAAVDDEGAAFLFVEERGSTGGGS